jgi:hypothetical protein
MDFPLKYTYLTFKMRGERETEKDRERRNGGQPSQPPPRSLQQEIKF